MFVPLHISNECFSYLCIIFFFNFVGMLLRALESDWAVVSEEIGLWIPIEVVNEEHNDKPEGETEIEIGNSLVKKFPPIFL